MFLIQRSAVIFFLIWTSISVSFAGKLFVSTTGNDTTGILDRIDLPFRTIPKAIAVAALGDTIYIRGGVYAYSGSSTAITLPQKTGASEVNRCYLISYPGERALLDFSAMTGTSADGIKINGNYWYLKGLDLKGAPHNGLKISSGNYNVVEFCTSFENRNTGVQLAAGASYNRFINCDSYYNADASYGNADGFSPKLDVGTGNYFYGCRAWQNSDDGFDGYLRPSDDITTTIENCWVFMNGYLKNGSSGTGNGNGFKLGGGDTSNIHNLKRNVVLKSCLAFENLAKGFDQNHNKGSMTLLNCTGYNNAGYNYALDEAISFGKVLTITNCFEYGDKRSIGAFTVQTTNSWQGFTVTIDDFNNPGGFDTTGVRGPRNTDGSLPIIQFMHLNPSSDLVNNGTDVGLPYNGSVPDIGCFETVEETNVKEANSSRVTAFKLFQNYPNPFNSSTIIKFYVGTCNYTSLRIYDILGREVVILVNGIQNPGMHTVSWDGKNSAGWKIGSGVYFCRFKGDAGFVNTMKIIILN
jgi:hypothetical protein